MAIEVDSMPPESRPAFEELLKSLRETIPGGTTAPVELPTRSGDATSTAIAALSILWIGDEPDGLDMLFAGLQSAGGTPRLTLCRNIDSATGLFASAKPDILVSRITSRTDIDSLVRITSAVHAPPVIVLASGGDEDLVTAAFRAGVYDYISERELCPEAVRAAVLRALMRRKLEQEAESAHARVAELVHRDSLTGLHNRRYFENRLETEFARARRFGEVVTLVLLDVDHFKDVNDQHGHQVGDHVLVETAKILAGASRNIDLVARLGGEEFALLLPHTQPEGARLLVARIIERIGSSDLGPGDTAVHITVSAGVAAYPHHECRTRQELYKFADTALYAAKGAGRNRCILFDPGA